MGAVSSRAAAKAAEIIRPSGREADQMVGSVLADVARALWPHNTAPSLAAAAHCEVRTAERYLGGQRDWSGDAIAAIVAEIMRRHWMRNLKVVKRQ